MEGTLGEFAQSVRRYDRKGRSEVLVTRARVDALRERVWREWMRCLSSSMTRVKTCSLLPEIKTPKYLTGQLGRVYEKCHVVFSMVITIGGGVNIVALRMQSKMVFCSFSLIPKCRQNVSTIVIMWGTSAGSASAARSSTHAMPVGVVLLNWGRGVCV
jgi:hypothetical protein